ncbi:uncharacterized protein LOC102607330 [Citrus sinensis]|uniref:uncharacterized protein LOC102607330 n=1 Tax=Citrus sinensis TaxID=2711 RepID=UPI00076365C8|nr:uncharacterized protein LOC102607330 [Citrus sinensis]XP_024041967.1 uncharacterized protein LOC18043382 [Citrus x clementina]
MPTCPATKNRISTAENINDLIGYTPPWFSKFLSKMLNVKKNERKLRERSMKKPVSREVAMEELLQVLVDDVEFSFPPERDSIVEYRSALRLRNFDFDANRKRIKALRLALEQKGWASADNF